MRTIVLTKGLVTIVDDADYDVLSQWKWCAAGIGKLMYAVHPVRVKSRPSAVVVAMHRVIMNAPKGVHVDHKNCETLDNQRGNLRLATRSQNNANRRAEAGQSAFKGVYRVSPNGRWKSSIRSDKRTTHLGVFDDEISAARAYDAAARLRFGEFARLNFPEAFDAI